ncbi:MAG TPA: CvpA family protein [Bryobacteraceae bacterium]|nr:CvpA family protein [Bryobacteraceae bacterium]
MNWLDIILGLILLLSVIGGLRKGIARTGIGFAAVILGLFCGLWFYGLAGGFLGAFISSRPLANLVGFLAIFVLVLLLGGVVTALIERLLKLARLSWLNRLVGGAFGAVRGILTCAVVVLVLMVFSTKGPPHAVTHSRIAPYVMGAARIMAHAAPYEVRDAFDRSYAKIRKTWTGLFEKTPRRMEPEPL